MNYRLQGRMEGASGIALDTMLIVASDAMAIELAKGYPIFPGQGYANWARLTRLSDGEVIWEIGDL